jgi:hypothetical protein
MHLHYIRKNCISFFFTFVQFQPYQSISLNCTIITTSYQRQATTKKQSGAQAVSGDMMKLRHDVVLLIGVGLLNLGSYGSHWSC